MAFPKPITALIFCGITLFVVSELVGTEEASGVVGNATSAIVSSAQRSRANVDEAPQNIDGVVLNRRADVSPDPFAEGADDTLSIADWYSAEDEQEYAPIMQEPSIARSSPPSGARGGGQPRAMTGDVSANALAEDIRAALN